MNKIDILENVVQYSAEELLTYIRNGLVTFDELVNETDGDLSPKVRREIKRLLESGDSDAWAKAKSEGTLAAVQHYLDTYPEGKFRVDARSLKAELEIIKKDENNRAATADAWNRVDKTSLDSLREFNRQHPGSPYAKEANDLINSILIIDIIDINAEYLGARIRQIQTDKQLSVAQKDYNTVGVIKEYIQDKKKISKEDFLELLSDDHNLLSAGVVKGLVDSGVIYLGDLLDIGIEKPFLQRMLEGDSPDNYDIVMQLDEIHKQSTEIYFWGIPSSGKSCALGAILSVANSGRIAHSMDPDTESQGYGYMNYLITHSPHGDVGTLIGRTPLEGFYEMGFDLVDKDWRIHPITCVDMAGELMRCMFKLNAKMPLTDTEERMLDTMTNVLIDKRSTNRKMHFFVIEYGAEDRTYEGYPQTVYLEGAVSYIKNTGIFKKDTDAIFILVTKADKIKNATKDTVANYIEEKYKGFYNSLETICRENEINKGKVEKLAFSLGNVCFQNYCKFNPRPAENVVDLLLRRTASYRGGKIGKLEKSFRK